MEAALGAVVVAQGVDGPRSSFNRRKSTMSHAIKLARTTLVVALASSCALLSALPAHAGFLGAGGAVAGGGALGGAVGGALGSAGPGSVTGGAMGMGGIAGGTGGAAAGQRRSEAGSAIIGRGEAGVSQEIRPAGRRLIDATDNAAAQAAARGRNLAGQAQGRSESPAATVGANGSAAAAGQVDGQGAVGAERADGSVGAGILVRGSAQGSVRR